mmetsp:Transcript_161958/g.311035  ORF Transcript_161958/g.311035 Transcript_161958/m.311035 type:complete len:92 (+) Transcript_161958:10-285(+)
MNLPLCKVIRTRISVRSHVEGEGKCCHFLLLCSVFLHALNFSFSSNKSGCLRMGFLMIIGSFSCFLYLASGHAHCFFFVLLLLTVWNAAHT